jgi:hypothetical protein
MPKTAKARIWLLRTLGVKKVLEGNGVCLMYVIEGDVQTKII